MEKRKNYIMIGNYSDLCIPKMEYLPEHWRRDIRPLVGRTANHGQTGRDSDGNQAHPMSLMTLKVVTLKFVIYEDVPATLVYLHFFRCFASSSTVAWGPTRSFHRTMLRRQLSLSPEAPSSTFRSSSSLSPSCRASTCHSLTTCESCTTRMKAFRRYESETRKNKWVGELGVENALW